LEFLTFAILPVIDNFFNLLLFFSVNQVWWGSGEVWSMVSHLPIREKKGGMKHVMDSPIVQQLKPIGYQRDDL
jgi:hypothetical protein